MFNSMTQSVPERFIDKQNIDRELKSCYESHLLREGNIVFVEEMKTFREEMKTLKVEQARLRLSCENLIKESKPRGGGMA